jgi:hypothetical protein
MSSSEVVARELLQFLSHVARLWHVVPTPNVERRVPAYLIEQMLTHPVPTISLFERMSQSMIGRYLWIGYVALPNPYS